MYKKHDNKRYIYEQRHAYLQTITQLRKDNKTIIYTDETWINAHYTQEHIWIDFDGREGWKVPSGKGQRFVLMEWRNGLGADLVFRSSIDYHDKMNSEHYMEWFTKQLLPNVHEKAVIVVDNATYTCTITNRKTNHLQQLTEKMTLNDG